MKSRVIDGLKLTCRYAWNCEKAKTLGISDHLYDFVFREKIERQVIKNIKEMLKTLDVYKFYCEIANPENFRNIKNGPFDFFVVSSHFKGTRGLKTDLFHNYTTLIPLLMLPIEYIKTERIEQCFVLPAKVKEVKNDDFLIAEYGPIIKHEGALKEADWLKEVEVENAFCDKIKKDDYVVVHFSSVAEKINFKEAKILSDFTGKALRKFEEKRKFIKSKRGDIFFG